MTPAHVFLHPHLSFPSLCPSPLPLLPSLKDHEIIMIFSPVHLCPLRCWIPHPTRRNQCHLNLSLSLPPSLLPSLSLPPLVRPPPHAPGVRCAGDNGVVTRDNAAVGDASPAPLLGAARPLRCLSTAVRGEERGTTTTDSLTTGPFDRDLPLWLTADNTDTQG